MSAGEPSTQRVEHLLRQLDGKGHGVWRVSNLLNNGFSRWHISVLIKAGYLRRIRQGWVAAENAPYDLVRAVAAGAVLSGSHRLKLIAPETVWVPHRAAPQLWVPSAPSTAQVAAAEPHARLHSRPRISKRHIGHGVAPWRIALNHALRHLTLQDSVALADTLLLVPSHTLLTGEYFEPSDIEVVLAATQRGREVMRWWRLGCENGFESYVFAGLRLEGFHVQTQVELPDKTRFDGLIDGRIGIELNGAHHFNAEQHFRDIRKASLGTRCGYIVLSFDYDMVMNHWEVVLETIRAALAQLHVA